MDRNPKPRASFWKFLVDDDFSSKLRIPIEFVNKNGEILHPKITVRTDADQSGKLWSVGIEQVGQHRFFTDGWSKFTEDVDLKYGEFMMFKFVAGDQVGVPGNFPLKVKIEDNQETDCNTVRSWRFSKELKKYHFTTSRLEIPKRFAIDTGIATNRKIKLQDGKGRRWPVKITDKNIGFYAMTVGWKNFLIGNKVVAGNIISFEFIPSSHENIIEALVVENGTRKEHIIPAKRGKGKPPLSRRS